MVAEDETEYYENGSDSDEKANEMVGVERKISREVFSWVEIFNQQEKCEIALFAPLTDVYRGSAEPKMEFLRATFGFTNM